MVFAVLGLLVPAYVLFSIVMVCIVIFTILTCISQKLCLYFCSYKQFSYFQGAHSPEEPGRHGKVRESVLAYGQLP